MPLQTEVRTVGGKALFRLRLNETDNTTDRLEDTSRIGLPRKLLVCQPPDLVCVDEQAIVGAQCGHARIQRRFRGLQ